MLSRPHYLLAMLAIVSGPDCRAIAQEWVAKEWPTGRRLAAAEFDPARGHVLLHGGDAINGRLTDSWEWDGARWTPRVAATSPPRLKNLASAYDSRRGRVVVVGYDGSRPRTFEWDGHDWTDLQVAVMPWVTNWVAMAYDVARGLVIAVNQGNLGMETWTWDGGTWTQLSPTARPPRLSGATLAYDASRQIMLLFGGSPRGPATGAPTWLWDGITWREHPANPQPPVRSGAAMSYDSDRQRIVLHGGTRPTGVLLDDTWEWDGARWIERTGPGPGGRTGAAMAYDAARRRTVLTCGWGGIWPPSGFLRDTWEWDGALWRRIDDAPLGRSGHSLGYDQARQRVVLFGDLLAVNARTWEWDGSAWHHVTPAVAPPARRFSPLVYDSRRQRLLLFGGRTPVQLFGDFWSFDGAAWTQHTATPAPSPRAGHGLAYDSARDRVVLFGGDPALQTWEWDGTGWTLHTPANQPLANGPLVHDAARGNVLLFNGETWEWDGSDWQQRTPATVPDTDGQAALAYDASRQRVVLFGGARTSPGLPSSSNTWEWDGTDWARTGGAAAPAPRIAHAMVYDHARQQIVLYGGHACALGMSCNTADDLWVYGSTPAAIATQYGTGCGTPTAVLEAYGRPWRGNGSFALRTASTASTAGATLLGGAAAATPIGAGCTLLVDPAMLWTAVPWVSNSHGIAHLPLPIAGAIAVRGIAVHAQSAVLGPATLRWTQGLRAVVGE